MKEKKLILFFCMIIVAKGVFCQQIKPLLFINSKDSLKKSTPVFYNANYPFAAIPANYYCTQLGFFCKKEIKFEAATKIPLKFRLGTFEYNDRMDGKSGLPNHYKREVYKGGNNK